MAVVALLGACGGNRYQEGQPAPPADRSSLTTRGDVLTRDQIEQINPSRMSDLIEGRFAGVSIVSRGGVPLIAIRGRVDPLIVIDNVPLADASAFWSLNPHDVEQIRIVKDGGAALYGVRGSRGVVEITTRIQ